MTAAQLVAHLIGDYIFQSHWMGQEKTRRMWPATVHALSYGLPFLLLRPTVAAWLVIVASHFVIDRWRLARFVVWAKNLIGPARYRAPWPATSSATGYPDNTPPWLAFWLLIIADNTLHVLCNGAALAWL